MVRGPSTIDMLLHIHRSRFIHAHMHVRHACTTCSAVVKIYPRIIDMLGLTARSAGQDMSGKLVS